MDDPKAVCHEKLRSGWVNASERCTVIAAVTPIVLNYLDSLEAAVSIHEMISLP